MFAKIFSATISGFDALPVQVETDIGGGLPGFTLVGLPDASISESKERLKAAMKNSGYPMPGGKITINLAPADLPKEGSGIDLAVAASILAAEQKIDLKKIEDLIFIGELSLNGELRHTRGILPITLLACQKNFKGVVIPSENFDEAIVVPGIKVYSFSNLKDLIEAFSESGKPEPEKGSKKNLKKSNQNFNHIELEAIKGQSFARRALEIAAAGGHNLIFAGPPGAGKTLLARALPTILPPLSFEEALDVTRIYSIKGLLTPGCGLIYNRPFRDPHHTISNIGMIGGGRIPAPGEVSLAHHGVLFLDELPEFSKAVLEVLREPITSGQVTISRANQTSIFPASFMFIAAMNPCPCGFRTDPLKDCVCSSNQMQQYQRKLSGPLLDRIDLQVIVPRLAPDELAAKKSGETSAKVRKRVEKSRKFQLKRNKRHKVGLNAAIPAKKLDKICNLGNDETRLLISAARRYGLSARGYDKIIRVARTIADLDKSLQIKSEHIAEALQFRTQDIFVGNN
ncbi:MAG: YifB family Mg chelatase-like AAA ATPase [Candidatus Rifleibacteriota bacterium]